MTDTTKEYKHNTRALATELFDIAKFWFSLAMVGKLATFIIGITAILLAAFSQEAPFFVALLSATSELFMFRSDTYREMAEAIRRKVDLQDSFGWPISRAELSDLLVKTPSYIRKKVEKLDVLEPYFDSIAPAGPKRALENIRESAWWSKHLTERTGQFYLGIVIVLTGLSLVVLIVSIQTIQNFDILSNIGRVVTATIMLLFSLSLIKMTRGYYKFGQKSARTEDLAEKLLAEKCEDVIQAVKVINEYHLARASSPIIPTSVWKWMRDDLNQLWKSYRSNPQDSKE